MGAALHDLDSDVYAAVFSPGEDRPGDRTADVGFGNGSVAGYVLRPASPDPEFSPAIEWILIGDAVGSLQADSFKSHKNGFACIAEARANGTALPVTALVDQFYARLQARGGGRRDTSSLIALLRDPA